MRLAYKDTDERIRIILDKSIKPDQSNGAIMRFGCDNLYPHTVERLISGSPTAKSCSNIYARFITGLGFVNAEINDVVVGKDEKGKSITMLQLLRQSASSISKNRGFYIHSNKTIENKVKNVRLIPFKNCRFNKIDDLGYCSKILAYDNWQKDKDIKFDVTKIKAYDIFTNDDETFANQIKRTVNGEIEKYRGQVYFHFFDSEYLYPLSMIDSVYLDCDTEAQISIFRNSEIKNGFQSRTIIMMGEPESEEAETELIKKVKGMIGADGDRITLMFTKKNQDGKLVKDENFYTETINSAINDKLFESWESGLANNIRKAFNGLPAVLIDYEQGKLSGTSGEAIIQATNYYNEITRDDRSTLSMSFKELFSKTAISGLESVTDWSITELKFNDGITNV